MENELGLLLNQNIRVIEEMQKEDGWITKIIKLINTQNNMELAQFYSKSLCGNTISGNWINPGRYMTYEEFVEANKDEIIG